MTEASNAPCSMSGAFELHDGCDLASFKPAVDEFSQHLRDEGYLLSWRIWRRARHDGYDSNSPDLEVMIEMTFVDHAAAVESWEYVERWLKPMQGLHIASNAQIRDPFFVLMNEV